MIGVMAFDWSGLAAATVVAVPATYAAWRSYRNGKNMKTSNGKTMGEYTEGIWVAVTELQHQFIEHIQDGRAHFPRQYGGGIVAPRDTETR